MSTPTLNPDGLSVKGCSYIYAPKGQAGEYAPLAANPYRGCGHSCAYCYVPLVTKQPRTEFNAGAVERPGFREGLLRDAQKYEALGVREQVMLSFTTDPYHPGDTNLTRYSLILLASHGLGFCTLTKGGSRALRDIKLFQPGRDAFASTLTSLDLAFSKKWEPDAKPPQDRITALKEFNAAGIFTWVSLEPTLDVEASLQIVRETHGFVDLYRLGKTLTEAFTAFAKRVEQKSTVTNVGTLLDRYTLEVVPSKAPKTAYDNRHAIRRLRAVFGEMGLTEIAPHHVYRYVDLRNKPTAAKREVEVLSHAFTKAVEWGIINRHPFKGEVRLKGAKARDRYVDDWEIVECFSLPRVRLRGSVGAIQAYIRLKLLTGLRRGDMLRLRQQDCRDDGIHVTTHKTGKRVIYEWTPERRSAVEAARAARPVDISPFLFCNSKGESYLNEATGTASGFNSMWQNFMGRVLKETKVTQRFTEHDLRAKCASDAETLEKARALLAHVDTKMTLRVYRRKPERV